MDGKTIRVLTHGGLGDILLSAPSFKALRQKYPAAKISVYCLSKSHMEVYKGNPHIDRLTMASFWANPALYLLYYLKKVKLYSIDYGHLIPSINYSVNATEIIAGMLNVELKDKKIEVFLTGEEESAAKRILAEYRNPIVLHVSSITSKNQEWPLKNWEDLIGMMPDHTFIQLGLTNDAKVKGAIDLRGKTGFRVALAIIKHSLSFVGVVSSFSHATNAFDTPGVILFGASSPQVWGHSNNINIYKALRCAPCIDLLHGSLCPYGKPCMKSITVDDVRNALLRQLGASNTIKIKL
jgi:ADP-heptose:LPS heptosyltransferase